MSQKRKFTREEIVGLYRIGENIHEDNDLSVQLPVIRQRLRARHDAWMAALPARLWLDPQQ